jgi:hypothetical protein
MNDGSCCSCCDKAVGVGLSELRRRNDKDRFYKFVTELSDMIGACSCGCMGNGYTLEDTKERMKEKNHSFEFITDIFDKYYHR